MLVRAGGMAQAIEHLPGKHKVLSLNPSTDKKKCGIQESTDIWDQITE
jgi:hypothetical protein